ncbi:MAG: PLP-dependent aminotransferase family protein [Pseudomonadota bacterium]
MTTYLTSKISQSIKSSHVRDLLQMALRPDMISMAGGLPAAELFDVEGIQQAAQLALAESPSACLQYGMTEGQQRLKDALVRHLAAKGVHATNDTLVVTTGSQQALDLMGRTMLDPGDRIAVERPTYLSALQAFNLYSPEFVSIAVDRDGGCVEQLERLTPGQMPKLVYVVTNFANPSGASMSLERRAWLARWAVRNKVFVLEDDPYGDLYFGSSPLPPLAAIARDIPGATEWCGYTSTLSKCVAPGLRIGWLVLPAELARAVAKVKQAIDLHTSSFAQEVAARYLESGRLPGRLDTIRKEYRTRRDALQAALQSRFGAKLTFNTPEGGLFLWAKFNDGTQSGELLRHALERNVIFVPGDLFFADTPDLSTLRINFSGATAEKIATGVDRMFEAHAAYRRETDGFALLAATA